MKIRFNLAKIHEIADSELIDPDTIMDIRSDNLSRRKLWRSAFTVGFQMGQAGVEKYEDLPP